MQTLVDVMNVLLGILSIAPCGHMIGVKKQFHHTPQEAIKCVVLYMTLVVLSMMHVLLS